MNESYKVICVIPTKNESWIIQTALSAASVWADHIIVADQFSTDSTRDLVLKYPKAKLILNENPRFNEPERQKLLIQAAREIPAKKRLIVALDADELLCNPQPLLDCFFNDQYPDGTCFTFRLLNIHPSLQSYWEPDIHFPFAIIDHGAMHLGADIHSPRIPIADDALRVSMPNSPVLHLQYIDWLRMESKHKWYQCHERLIHPTRSAVSIYRQYHHMYMIRKKDLCKIQSQHMEYFISHGIKPFHYTKPDQYYWDEQTKTMLLEHGDDYFRRIDHPYGQINLFDQFFLSLLKWTQPYSHSVIVRFMDYFLTHIDLLLRK